MRLAAPFAAALAALLLACGGALARPLDLDDLLATEEIGQVATDPTGRWLVVERLRPYDQAPSYELGHGTRFRRSALWLTDLQGTGRLKPALPPPTGAGDTVGPFSPDGGRLAVMRLEGRSWTLGVWRLPGGGVRWTNVAPELPTLGRTLQWRSAHQLLVIARAPGDLPPRLRAGWAIPDRLAGLWRESAKGERATFTAVDSGRYASVRPGAPLKRLVSLDVRSGRATTLAVGDFYDLEISPDGRFAALAVELEDLPPPDGLLRVATSIRRRNLVLVDLAQGRVITPCPACDLATHLMAWSPASDSLLVYGRDPGASWAEGRLFRLSVEGTAIALPDTVRPDLAYTGEGLPYVRADWLGGDPIVFGKIAGAQRPDWHRLDRHGPVNLSFRLPATPVQLAKIEADGLVLLAADGLWRVGAWGAAQRLAEGRPTLIAAPAPGAGDRARVNAAPRSGLVTVAQLGGAPRPTILAEDIWRHGLAAGDEPRLALGDRILVERRDAHGVLTLGWAGEKGAPLLVLNRHLTGVTPPVVKPVRHFGPDGAPLTSWLYLPAESPPKTPLPLVVLPYPGVVRSSPAPLYGGGGASLTNHPAPLVAAGYGVLVPSLPRSPSAAGEPGAGLAAQILAAVDAAAAGGEVDAGRVALWGQSFGGYAALMAATQSARIKAVIASAAPTDLAALRGAFTPQTAVSPEDGLELTMGAGWSEAGQGGLGAPPWTDAERYRRNSPLYLADQINAPVLLFQGDRDNISITQGQAMFSALWRLGRDAQLVTLWGEGHVPASPANLREVYERAKGFLARSLPPETLSPASVSSPDRPARADRELRRPIP